MNTSCKITYPSGESFTFNSIEEASKGTEDYYSSHPTLAKKYRPILSIAAIKLRCNKSDTPKDNVICEWLDEHTLKHYRAKKSKNKGKDLEYRIRDRLREIGFTGAERSAGESKRMDNNKVDISDIDNKLPVAIQAKNYAKTPNYFGIRESSTDERPFCLCWKKNTLNKDNIVYMIPEDLFYDMLLAYSKYNNIL